MKFEKTNTLASILNFSELLTENVNGTSFLKILTSEALKNKNLENYYLRWK